MIRTESESRDALLERAANAFFEAAGRGEQPSIDDYAQQYLAIAEDIRRVFPALAMVGELSASGALKIARHTDEVHGQLGDFRVIRELGRGGMGIVYEAEQVSLNRRVAFKILPFAGTLDQRALKRFKNEALAAAALDHPGIVNVYSVGCERGVHYYAMRLIDGQTLAELISDLRDSRAASQNTHPAGTDDDSNLLMTSHTVSSAAETPRDLAAAESLDFAHQHGILHRDVKPGNLLIDDDGRLWVTDFGLARIETGHSVTMTGDVLGTWRYMSPEVAAGGGERLAVDERTDIYSLGVTLYKLLTLRPALDAQDRHMLLQQIISTEPKSPRSLDRAIPEPLETIVLKAIRKDANDRYATAGELAADLRRFLNHQPILARRPTLADRASF